jgi:cholesterol oxidase
MAHDVTASAPRTEPGGSFDVVVIGSGFGGSVMAYRLACAGLSVCVLERGRAYPPGSFPRTPKQMSRNFWDPSENLFGLFDIWSFRQAEAIVSSGLGGGSLIYANVLLRKDENWFVQEPSADQGGEWWPLTRDDLDPHYDNVEDVLNPTDYPFVDETPKTRAFMLAGKALSHPASPAPLAITFNGDGSPQACERIQEPPNYHGARGTRYKCRLCGECDIGCNWGSKNTLDFNYLTMAAKAGAEIRTRCEVKRFEPDGGRGERGWIVTYVNRQGDDEDPSKPGHWEPRRDGWERRFEVDAKAVVLAAGCFGSTFLMQKMRDRRALQDLSPMVGKRFSGNGDALSFAARCRGWKGDELVPHTIDPTYGPVITSYLRYADHLDDPDNEADESRGFYLEDGGFPNLAAWGVELTNTPGIARRAAAVGITRLKQRLLGMPGSTIGAEASRFLGDAEYSGGSLPILAMGRDFPDGELKLSKKGFLELDWRGKRSNPYFEKVREVSSYVATALAARDFKVSLSWHLRRLLTVHPIGGLPMGITRDRGVVDPWGRVFGYENLYVADGSVMPGPVGPNPSFTIAALADRFAQHALEEELNPATTAAPATPSPAEPSPTEPVSASTGRFSREALPENTSGLPGSEDLDLDAPPVHFSFTEEMDGFITFGDSNDYAEGFRRGRQDGNALGFNLTIEIDDVARFVSDEKHEARAEGYIESADFGRARPVPEGLFNLFALVGDPPVKQMLYELPFADANDNPFILRGHKIIKDDPGFDAWKDLTTLFTRIVDADPPPGQEGQTIAYGILHISLRAFLEQLQTFYSSDGASGVATFARFFFGSLADTYGPRFLGERGGAP